MFHFYMCSTNPLNSLGVVSFLKLIYTNYVIILLLCILVTLFLKLMAALLTIICYEFRRLRVITLKFYDRYCGIH